MVPASYVVIRYVADPARNEPLNVGVLAWSEAGNELAIDREAVARVVRENPRLHTDALLALEETLRQRLGLDEGPPGAEIRERLQDHPGFPITMTEPRHTTVAGTDQIALRAAVDRLVQRIVTPRRRHGGGAVDAVHQIEKVVRPLIRGGWILPDHVIERTRTGVARRVDFYANSGANVVLDTIRLDLKQADQITLRADAEANKITDIAHDPTLRLVVFTTFSDGEGLEEVNEEARRILAASPSELVTNLADATRLLEQAGSSHATAGR